MGIFILQIIGIIILSIIFLILLLTVTNTSYEAKGNVNSEEACYSFKIGMLGDNLKFIGKGKGLDLNLIFKIFFIEKEKQFDSHNKKDKKKSNKKDNSNDKHEEKSLKNKIENIKKYKKPFIKILSILKPKYFRLEGTYGLEDPSITGMLCGVTSVLPSIFPGAIINLNPNFLDEEIDIESEIKGRIRIAVILVIVAKLFIASKSQKFIAARRKV